MTEDEREVWRAKEIDGMTFAAIGLALGRPKDTIVSVHARAMRKLEDKARASERSAKLRVQQEARERGKGRK